MNSVTRAFLIGVLWFFAARAADEPQGRVSIPKLLDPATRAETVRQFRQHTPYEGMGGTFVEKDLAKFVERAGTITVHPFPLHGEPVGYVVLHGGDPEFANLPRGDDPFAQGKIHVGRPRVLLPIPARYGCVIRADGTFDAKENENSLLVGPRRLLADFDGDGHCDAAEMSTTRIAPGGGDAGEYSVERLTISELSDRARVTLEVEWNLRRRNGEPAEWWGWWFEDEDGDGVFDLKLGPSRDGVATPRVIFHWDARQAKWIGSGLGPDVPCRVVVGSDSGWNQALKDGKLTVPSAPASTTEEIAPPAWEAMKADEYSHPWKPHSLAGRTHAEIFEAMTKRRTTYDFVREKGRREWKLPDLWVANPRDIARAMVRTHRAVGSRDSAWIAFDTTDAATAPEVGTVTIADGPSGCFAPSGAFITQLHCGRDGSHLAFFATLTDYDSVPFTRRRTEFEIRRIELSHAEARQILQLVWWLSRVRLWHLDDEPIGICGGSTSDGYATVRIEANGHRAEYGEIRLNRYFESPLLGGASGSPGDRMAFVNLAVWLFDEWVPERIGARWSAEATPLFGNRRPPSAALLDRLHERTRQGLESFLAGHASEESASVLLSAVGANGWIDLRPLVQKVSAVIPPPGIREARLRVIDEKIAGWVRDHGETKAGDAAHSRRDESAKARAGMIEYIAAVLFGFPLQSDGLNVPGVPEVPGLAAPPELPFLTGGNRWQIFSEEECRQFAPLDALYEERSKLGSEQTDHDRGVAALRLAVSETSRLLDLRDDPAGLEKWLRESRWLGSLEMERLISIAPKRAAAVLRERLPKVEPRSAGWIREALATLAPAVPLPDAWPEAALAGQRPPREDEIEQLSAHSPHDGSVNNRAFRNWLRTLVPPDEPRRYPWPALDEKLLALNKGGHSIPESSEALARRAPPGTWEILVESNGSVALAIFSTSHPEHREKFRELLGAKLAGKRNELDDAAFAAWLAEVREVGPAMERVATSSAADAEGQAAPARRHLPRWVLTLWREPDPTARAKALLAFACGESFELHRLPEAWKRMEAQFMDVWRTLDESQRRDVRAFLDWCSGDGQGRIAETASQEKTASILGRLRGLLDR